MDIQHWPVMLIALPLLASLLAPLVHRFPRFYHGMCMLLGIGSVGWMLFHHESDLYVIVPSLFSLYFDKYSWFFILLIDLTWVITLIYAYGYLQNKFQERKTLLYRYLHLSIALVSASAMAGNIITILIFYLLSITAGYFLITLAGNLRALKIGKQYILQNFFPAFALLLPAALYIGLITQNQDFSHIPTLALQLDDTTISMLVALMVLGMGMNLVFPFNTWLPNAWMTAAPISALMHSVAAINIGAITLLKLVVYVFGMASIERLSNSFFHTQWLIYLCGANAVWAAWRAWKTQNMKQRFSYSTVSQVSYIISGLLIGSKLALFGALLHIFSHGLAKIALFFIAGSFNVRLGTVEIPKVGPYLPHARWEAAAVTLCGLSIIGFPLLAGFYSKDLILLEEIAHHHYGAAFFLLVGSFINILYIYPVARNAFWVKPNPELQLAPMNRSMAVAIALCAFLLVTFSLYTPLVLSWVNE
jgi:multicomponent Na+:H+ antiporter subunit D